MEVKIDKNNVIRMTHKLKPSENYKVSKGSKFRTISIFSRPQIVKGFSNACEDGQGILVIDYDCVDKSVVLEDYKLIEKRFKLPQGYLFKTKENNFHTICLKKFPQSKIFEILQYTRCDSNFRTMTLRNPYRSYVLRLSNKKGSKSPKFVELLGKEKSSIYDLSEISSAHLTLLKKVYNINHPKYPKQDNLKKIKVHTYET